MTEFAPRFTEFRRGSCATEQATLTIALARDLLHKVDGRFHAVLDAHNGRATAAIERYSQAIEGSSPRTIIRAVRISLNDYLEKLGVGLMGLNIEFMGRESGRHRSERILRRPDEWRSPTLGVIPEDLIREFGAQLIQFESQRGCEIIEAVSSLQARGFLYGENMDLSYGILPQPEGTEIVVPEGCAIGVRAAVPDKDKAKLRRVNYREIVRDELTRPEQGPERTGQIYWCRYVEQEAR